MFKKIWEIQLLVFWNLRIYLFWDIASEEIIYFFYSECLLLKGKTQKYENNISYSCMLLIHAVMHVLDLHPNFLLVEWWMYNDYVETILLLQAEIILLLCFHCREIRKNLNIPILTSSTIRSLFQSVNGPAVVNFISILRCVCVYIFSGWIFLLSFVMADRKVHVLFLKVEISIT